MINKTINDTQILKWKNPKQIKYFTDDHNAHFQVRTLCIKR